MADGEETSYFIGGSARKGTLDLVCSSASMRLSGEDIGYFFQKDRCRLFPGPYREGMVKKSATSLKKKNAGFACSCPLYRKGRYENQYGCRLLGQDA
jgi:hypothetical protein